MKSYLEEILDFYEENRERLLEPERTEKIRQCVLDLAGCGIAGAGMETGDKAGDGTGGLKPLLTVAREFSGSEPVCSVWGTDRRYSMPAAVFVNGTLASRLELDDVTSVGASVHPGASVIPAVLAAAEIVPLSGKDFLYAVMLGYEVCNRFGIMATERVRELGMYGPAFVGNLGAVAAAGAALKLSRNQIIQSFSITASLSPVCPFISFMDGAEVKEYYNGWSLLTAMAALCMAEAGVTGADRVWQGKKSMESFYRHDRRMPVTGADYAYKTLFKKYACCRSVHYALTALEEMMEEREIRMDEVTRIKVETYPYAYDLSSQVVHLNPVSARLSIPYCMAAMLKLKRLEADAFQIENLKDSTLHEWMKRVTVETGGRYGAGPFALRGAKVTIELRNGSYREKAVEHVSWGEGREPAWSDLAERFCRMTAGRISEERQERIIQFLLHLDSQENVLPLIQMMRVETAGVSEKI